MILKPFAELTSSVGGGWSEQWANGRLPVDAVADADAHSVGIGFFVT